MKGPLSEYAEHLRHLASQLDRYREPSPAPIQLVWHDVHNARWIEAMGDENLRNLMRKKFFALMTLAGIDDKEAQLELVGEILGTHSQRREPITSRAELTLAELGRVTQALQDWETIEGYANR